MASPEQLAREKIDKLLTECGWILQDRASINLPAGRGIALREGLLKAGEADYLLFADQKIIGTVEAKPEGYTLIGVEEQSGKYGKGVLENHPKWHDPLPFAYESTGTETRFTNRLDPVPTSRNVFAFHRPETLIEWAQQSAQLNQSLRDLPTTDNRIPNRAKTRIVAEVERRLSVVVELEAVVTANLQRAMRLRQSILQQAFEGKLARAN